MSSFQFRIYEIYFIEKWKCSHSFFIKTPNFLFKISLESNKLNFSKPSIFSNLNLLTILRNNLNTFNLLSYVVTDSNGLIIKNYFSNSAYDSSILFLRCSLFYWDSKILLTLFKLSCNKRAVVIFKKKN
jgi:hypothetical protein